jgi:hypothetical protein
MRDLTLEPVQEATCIGCGCTDTRACVGLFGPCCWVRLDRAAGLGVCSACADLAEAWDSGDRRLRVLFFTQKGGTHAR